MIYLEQIDTCQPRVSEPATRPTTPGSPELAGYTCDTLETMPPPSREEPPGASHAWISRPAALLPPPRPHHEVFVEGVEDPADADVLETASRAFLEALDDGHLTIPRTVYMVNDHRGPMYRSGCIHTRFPFHADTVCAGRLVKPAQESIAINLHEVGHLVFDETVRARCADSPEVIWAFFTQVDMIGWHDSRELIDRTKAATRFGDVATDELHDAFFDFMMIGELYNELFADLTVACHLNDPDAIFDCIYFPDIAEGSDRLDREFQQVHQRRRFLESISLAEAERAMSQDRYAVFSPLKPFIWRQVVERHATMSTGALLSGVLDAMLESFREVTEDFTVPANEITAARLNESLRACLVRRFPPSPDA